MSTCRIYNGLYMKSEVSASMTAMQSLCAACLRMQSQSSCFTKASSAHRGAKMPLNIFIDDIIVAPVLYINHLFIFRLLLYYWCSWCCAVACELYDDRHLYQWCLQLVMGFSFQGQSIPVCQGSYSVGILIFFITSISF